MDLTASELKAFVINMDRDVDRLKMGGSGSDADVRFEQHGHDARGGIGRMKLSVCIPVYDVAPYVGQCARSLFAQTYEDMEFVFVDDGSPDESIAIVERVLKDFPNRADQVKILRHERNRGLVAARKTAIRAATGELIAHCDSDDWVDADLYEKMAGRMKAADADAVICSASLHRAERTFVVACPADLCASGREALRRMDEIPGLNSMVTKVVRRERVDLDVLEWPDDIRIAEDYCHMIQLLPCCRRIVGCPDALYHYRVNEKSMTCSTDVSRLVADHARVYDILTRRVPSDEGIVPRRNLARAILYFGTVHGCLSAREFERWRTTFASLDGQWKWTDMSLWGQRMMKLAKRSYFLTRLVSPLTRGKVRDCL